MASIEKRIRDGAVSWRVRYRDPQGTQRNKSFPRKVDASAFAATIEKSKLTGSYIDPNAGKATVGEWAVRWLDSGVGLKESSRSRDAGILRTHIIPRWRDVKLVDVSHSDDQTWVAHLSETRAPRTVRKIHGTLSRILAFAVKDQRIVRNPASGVMLPAAQHAERKFLAQTEVHRLADACGRYRTLVLFLSYTGLRWGEMAALRVRNIHLLRRRVYVKESVTVVNGRHVWGSPKTHEQREVAIPRFLIDSLAQQVAGRKSDDLVFSNSRTDSPLRSRSVRRTVLDAAAKSQGLGGLTPHSFRHTAASLAVAAGADVRVVQQMLGHKSATMTLDLYGHLLPDRLDEVADRLDAMAQNNVSQMCLTAPAASFVELHKTS